VKFQTPSKRITNSSTEANATSAQFSYWRNMRMTKDDPQEDAGGHISFFYIYTGSFTESSLWNPVSSQGITHCYFVRNL